MYQMYQLKVKNNRMMRFCHFAKLVRPRICFDNIAILLLPDNFTTLPTDSAGKSTHLCDEANRRHRPDEPGTKIARLMN